MNASNDSAIATDRSVCPLCAARVVRQRTAGTDFLVCTSCGYAMLPGTAGRTDYWDEGESADFGYWTEAKTGYFRSALNLLATMTRGRRIIDVGGGAGHFASIAIDAGWDANIREISPRALALAAERLGAERVFSTTHPAPPGDFDAVTMWCVVAHAPDPAPLIKEAVALLRPGGVLWLTTPNFSFQRSYARVRRLAGRPIDFAQQDHVSHFTPKALRVLCARAGLERVEFHYRGVTEHCILADSSARGLIRAKRAWNRLAHIATGVGLPDIGSELQMTARKATQ